MLHGGGKLAWHTRQQSVEASNEYVWLLESQLGQSHLWVQLFWHLLLQSLHPAAAGAVIALQGTISLIQRLERQPLHRLLVPLL